MRGDTQGESKEREDTDALGRMDYGDGMDGVGRLERNRVIPQIEMRQ